MRPAVRRLLFAPLVAVAVLAILEGLSRLVLEEAVSLSIPAEQVRVHLQGGSDLLYDPVLGWRRRTLPNPTLGLDANGFRHAPVAKAKQPGVLRGFALGDSQTYGAGLHGKDAWPSVAERLLQERGYKIELINTGLSGYRSIQALRLIQGQLAAFDPDFVIVDCQGRDSLRDDRPPQGDSVREFAQRTLFYSRLYRGSRIVVEQVQARLSPGSKRNLMNPELAVAPGTAPPPNQTPGNHDLIFDHGAKTGLKVFFLDYPFGDRRVQPLLHPQDLPAGADLIHSAPALLATQKSVPELFLDNNHLTVEGAAIVGAEVATAVAAWADDAARP